MAKSERPWHCHWHFYCETMCVINVKLCTMVALTELYPFIPLSLTLSGLTSFHGHSGVKQLKLKVVFFGTLLFNSNSNFVRLWNTWYRPCICIILISDFIQTDNPTCFQTWQNFSHRPFFGHCLSKVFQTLHSWQETSTDFQLYTANKCDDSGLISRPQLGASLNCKLYFLGMVFLGASSYPIEFKVCMVVYTCTGKKISHKRLGHVFKGDNMFLHMPFHKKIFDLFFLFLFKSWN